MDEMETAKSLPREAIAIIGMGCRVPGADDPDSLWKMVAERRESVIDYPGGRTAELDAFYRRVGLADGPASVRGGFLSGIDMFDAAFFEVSPREAQWLDPQQRLLLEVAWETLEDAGVPLNVLKKQKGGVFVGVWANDYERHAAASSPLADFFLITGGPLYAASSRLAFQFDLSGPDISVNAACGSSLAAIHLAVRSLRSGECSIALAGGVNVVARPEITQAFSRSKMLSADGRCKFGDASADGFVRSDGAGMLLLKRLSDAERDGDRILAVILGTAMTNDGRGSGFMATPSAEGQRQAMLDALANANVEAESVDLVEAHGTGTSAGDPIEISAIASVFGQAGGQSGEHARHGSACRLASVKSNIGHTESAAGVVSVIRSVQAMSHREFPATLHVKERNPAIDWEAAGVALELVGGAWEKLDGAPRRVAVNGLGLTGTNAHVILEEFRKAQERKTEAQSAYLLPISAASSAALRQRAREIGAALGSLPNPSENPGALADFCYTASVRRNHLAYRTAVVGADAAELRERLEEFSSGQGTGRGAGQTTAAPDGEAAGQKPRIAFVFPGQGSQWVGMGRELLRANPAFREAMGEIDRAIERETGWSVLRQLEDPAQEDRLGRIDVVQPTLFAVEVALAKLWSSWGIVPEAVVGHSMGEVAAAYFAGILSLPDAVKVICRRSTLLTRVAGAGAMVVVDLARAEAEKLLSGLEDKVAVAVCNSPRSTVLAGDPQTLNDIVEGLERDEIFCRWVRVDVASHSPQMDPLTGDLSLALADVRPSDGRVPMISTVRVGMLDGHEMGAAYWVENLRQPVLFADAVEGLLRQGFNTFLEMSPHPALVPFVEQTAAHSGHQALAAGSLRRDEAELPALLETLGRIYCAGADIDWQRIYSDGNLVKLPAYPWQRERFWIESSREHRPPSAIGHPLAGEPIRSASGDWIWAAKSTAEMHPWLKDHAVAGTVLLPASAYIELAGAAAISVFAGDFGGRDFGGGGFALIENLRLMSAAAFPPAAACELQVIAAPESGDSYALSFFWRETGAEDWTPTAECLLRRAGQEAQTTTELTPWEDAEFSSATMTGKQHSATMRELGYDFGPNFCRIDWLALQNEAGLARIELPGELRREQYLLHPAALDAALQLLGRLLIEKSGRQTLLPVAIGTVKWMAHPIGAGGLYARAAVHSNSLRGDVEVFDASGKLLFAAEGLEFAPLAKAAQPVDDFLYQMTWERLGPAESKTPEVAAGRWVLLSDAPESATDLAAALSLRGASVSMVRTQEFVRGGIAGGEAVRAVVWLDPLSIRPRAALVAAQQMFADGAALASRLGEFSGDAFADAELWTVTRGTQAVNQECASNVLGAGAWGLFASVANEYPSLQASCFDLPSERLRNEIDSLADHLLSCEAERRVALRGGTLFAARLNRFGAGSESAPKTPVSRLWNSGANEPEGFELYQNVPGSIDSLELVTDWNYAPEAGEVEIAVESAGINFRDVLRVMGLHEAIAASQIGGECSGIVRRVGPGLTRFRPGHAVLAMSPSFREKGMFSSYVNVPEELVAAKPESMSFAQAAGIPCVFLTAWYGLVKLARLQKGERVLIHAAAGGVGLAAIQIAQWIGAEIYATVSSEGKRDYLRSLGVTHLMHSRKLDFTREVLEATHGQGVDVVLNSLAGPAIAAGLEALAPYGRFIEIGKRDIWENTRIGLRPFQKNISMFAVDLAAAVEERRAMVGEMFTEVMDLFDRGVIQPDPTMSFTASRAAEAFQLMATGGHIGKIVLKMRDEAAMIRRDKSRFAPEATYLITGGLGALGLAAAKTLVERGARHLALVSRRPGSEEASQAIRRLRESGASVSVWQADVGAASEVKILLEEIRATMPPLRGIVHAAGVLDDAVASHLTPGKFETVMAGKVGGALALDALAGELDLDFLVYYSSAAGILGNPGQGNYAAANTILDALASNQRARGIPAISIDWGPWGEVGLAAAEDVRGARIASQGLKPVSPAEGAELLVRVLQEEPAQVAAMSFDPEQWRQSHPAAANSRLFANLTERGAGARQDMGDLVVRLQSLPGADLPAALIAWLREQVAAVLRMEVSRVPEDKPLRSLGLDSLMALELRNRMERSLRLKLSATLIWNYPTLTALASHLETRLAAELLPEQPSQARDSAEAVTASSKVEPHTTQAGSAAEMLEAELMEVESVLAQGERL
jgi:acyl transferase domain-containing protein/NADPH:quinone reductase-like Zn-dependent oxidoreductase/NAD(P)-dependent dehydrogenase (short-subunit alcohol dehydrogenase family)/acyl carrier protein